jgi:transposase-like protein
MLKEKRKQEEMTIFSIGNNIWKSMECPRCKSKLELVMKGKDNFNSYICVNCNTEFYDKGDGKLLTKQEFFEDWGV